MVVASGRSHIPRQSDQVHPVQCHRSRPGLKGQNVVPFHQGHVHCDSLGCRKLKCPPGCGVSDRNGSTTVDCQHLGGGGPRIGVSDGGFIVPSREGIDIKDNLTIGGGDSGHVISIGSGPRLGNRYISEMGVLGLEGLMSSQVRLGDLAPAIVVEDDLPYLEVRIPAMVRVVIMVGEITPAAVLEGFPATRTDVLGVGREKLGAATTHQGRSRLIGVSPRDGAGPAHPGVVSAVDALTAGIPGREKVIVPSMLQDRRSLNCAAATGSEGIHGLVGGQLFAGGGVDGDHLDARPKGPESQPDIAAWVDDHIGVDAVVIVSGTALDY